MAFLTNDPQVWILALLVGFIPSLLWLWFWLKEEENPEPKLLLTFVFIMGMVVVAIVLPMEKYVQDHVSSHEGQLLLWATIEEVMKYLAVLLILYKTNNANKPIDWPIYLITAALGFAAMENTLFLIKPFSINGAAQALFSATSLGHLRYLGSTLLHTISSGIIGIMIGISFYMNKTAKRWLLLLGFLIAIALHNAFNFFIMRNSGSDFLKVFAFLWVTTVVVILLFEKVRRMSEV